MQIANSFDKETLIKIGKGAFIAFTGAGSIALLQYFNSIKIDNAILASFVVWLVPTLVNVIKEWMAGVDRNSIPQ